MKSPPMYRRPSSVTVTVMAVMTRFTCLVSRRPSGRSVLARMGRMGARLIVVATLAYPGIPVTGSVGDAPRSPKSTA